MVWPKRGSVTWEAMTFSLHSALSGKRPCRRGNYFFVCGMKPGSLVGGTMFFSRM